MDYYLTKCKLITYLVRLAMVEQIVDPDSKPGDYKYLYKINPKVLKNHKMIEYD